MRKINRLFFESIEPIFPYVRDGLIFCKVLHHSGRQKFPIGFLDKNKTAEDFKSMLQKLGFIKCIIAWKDEGEILSLRKLDGTNMCYHIRLFEDGEIRGHYEWTVEASPWKHLWEDGMQAKTTDFKSFLTGLLASEVGFEKQVATVSR